MNAPKAFLSGLLGAAAMSLVAFVARALGFPFGFEMLLGSWVLEEVGYLPWLVGHGVHFVIGGVFGVIYAAIFRWLRLSGGAVGIVVSVVHLMFAGFLLALVPEFHPVIPEHLRAPGFFMSGHGPLGVTLFVVLHLVFGAVFGSSYRRATYARIARRGRLATYP